MALPVYSIQIHAIQGLNGSRDYVVPAGHVLVVRDADVYCDNSGSGGTFFLIGDQSQTIWHLSLAAFATTDGQWRGRQVIPAAGILRVTSDTDADVSVSGYLLTTP